MLANKPPNFDQAKGLKLLKVPTDQWNRILEAVDMITTLRGDDIIHVKRMAGKTQLSFNRSVLSRQFAEQFAPSITVGITTAPSATSKRLSVKRVVFKDPPNGPLADTDRPYKFDGEAFECVPFPGFEAFDYSGFEVGEEPTPGDTYFDASMISKEVGIIGPLPATGEIKNVTVAEEKGDYLLCVDSAGDPLKVAKPWMLRRTPFDGKTRGAVKYTYLSDIEREARAPAHVVNMATFDMTERQRIVPFYLAGDRLEIERLPASIVDVTVQTTGLVWEDKNKDGRGWARYRTGRIRP